MRKINTHHFHRATRTTPREINRKIVLNLVRELQPISRADLARKMNVGRGLVSLLVDDLLAERAIYEGADGPAAVGRKPKMLYVRTRDRYGIAVDLRFGYSSVMLSDFAGRQIALETFATPTAPERAVRELAWRIRRLLTAHQAAECEAIGLVVPGRVERNAGRLLDCPELGWREVDLGGALAAATGIPVLVENASVACALAQMWLNPFSRDGVDNFAFVMVADGVGVGMVVNGEVLRGHADMAGQFGHLPLELEGPLCTCGRRGCWEAYASDLATLARSAGLSGSLSEAREVVRSRGLSIVDLVARARGGAPNAAAALRETGRYLGLGLAGIINTLNPARILVGGEITEAWDLIETPMRGAVRERTISDAAACIAISPAPGGSSLRLRGGMALLVARDFAAPRLA